MIYLAVSDGIYSTHWPCQKSSRGQAYDTPGQAYDLPTRTVLHRKAHFSVDDKPKVSGL